MRDSNAGLPDTKRDRTIFPGAEMTGFGVAENSTASRLADKERPRICAVNGSERPTGNTARLLEYARELLDDRGIDLDVIRLWSLDMTPCGPCGDCNFRTVPCEVRDDVADAVERMSQADGIIYATSVHGFGSSPRMPAFLERSGTGYLRFQRALTNKVGGAIVTGRRYSHAETYGYLVHHLMLNRMIVPGFGFPAVLFGDGEGEVFSDEEGMEMLTRMLQRMADLIAVLREHRQMTGRDGLAVSVPGERHREPDCQPAEADPALATAGAQ